MRILISREIIKKHGETHYILFKHMRINIAFHYAANSNIIQLLYVVKSSVTFNFIHSFNNEQYTYITYSSI